MVEMFNLRLAIDTVGALAAALVCGVLGWFVAEPILSPICGWLALEQLTLLDPLDAIRYRLSIAVALALPPLVAWLAALIDRLITRADPTRIRLALYVLVPFLAAAGGFMKNLAWMKVALSSEVMLGSLRPSITLEGLELGWVPIRWTLRVALVLCTTVGILAYRRAAAKRGATS